MIQNGLNGLVHLSNPTITNQVEMWPHPENDAPTNPLDLYPSSRVAYPQKVHPSSEAGLTISQKEISFGVQCG